MEELSKRMTAVTKQWEEVILLLKPIMENITRAITAWRESFSDEEWEKLTEEYNAHSKTKE